MDDDLLSNILSGFIQYTDRLDKFIEKDSSAVSSFRDSTKLLYDECKQSDDFGGGDEDAALPELIVAKFSEEQIWQQLELQNEQCLDLALGDVARLSVNGGASLSFRPRSDAVVPEAASDSSDESEEDDSDEEEEEDDVELSDDEDYAAFMKRADASTSGLSTLAGGSLPVFGDSEDSDDMDDEEKEMKQLLERCDNMDKEDESDAGSEMSLSDDDEDNVIQKEVKETDSEDEEEYDLTNKKGARAAAAKASGTSILKGKDSSKARRRQPKGEADDKFFKAADMESFLRAEDIAEERRRLGNDGGTNGSDEDDDEEDEEAESDIDMFAELPSEDEEEQEESGAEEKEGSRDMKYSAFFDPPSSDDGEEDMEVDNEDVNASKKKKSVNFNEDKNTEHSTDKKDLLDSDDSDSEGEGIENKSAFELRQERMQKKIKQLEKASLDSKSWQMTGEVAALRRPENSLLQEHLDFDHTTRPAPEITEDTTAKLEEFIIQRIKDHIFDDVERKVKPKDSASEFKKTAVLNEEKSKLSLGEIYEQEFQKQVAAAKGEEKADVEDPKRVEIKTMMSSLFLKLDALSNFHFTPKQAPVEIRMISNQASIAVEDVAPVTISDATRLAPEEIMDKQKGHFKGDTERDSTDKKRSLRIKKKGQHDKRIHREKKDSDKLKANNGKLMSTSQALRSIKATDSKQVKFLKEDTSNTKLTSSKQFFSKLQDEVDNQVYSKKAELNKKKLNASKLSSAKLKL